LEVEKDDRETALKSSSTGDTGSLFKKIRMNNVVVASKVSPKLSKEAKSLQGLIL
jgi:hypothetical protein